MEGGGGGGGEEEGGGWGGEEGRRRVGRGRRVGEEGGGGDPLYQWTTPSLSQTANYADTMGFLETKLGGMYGLFAAYISQKGGSHSLVWVTTSNP